MWDSCGIVSNIFKCTYIVVHGFTNKMTPGISKSILDAEYKYGFIKLSITSGFRESLESPKSRIFETFWKVVGVNTVMPEL